MNNDFENMRPYKDEEIPAAMKRLANSPYFPLLADFVFPDRNSKEVRDEILSYNNIYDFQHGVMYFVNKQIVKRSCKGFTCGGMERISTTQNYLFVSNHRDIMLDASLLQNVLADNGHESSEITFGANLMKGQEVIDIGRSNKMFRVERPGGGSRAFYMSSLRLSQYLAHALCEEKHSVWIAQRNGRTKDGIDRTDRGIIRMFSMYSNGDKVKALADLHIVPIAVSYEWEPCDFFKTRELFCRHLGPYTKKDNEDFNSIIMGITQPKGHVHFEVCQPILPEELEAMAHLDSSDFYSEVARLIDERICTAYHLFPNNFIAHDILHGETRYADHYSDKERTVFLHRLETLKKESEGSDVELITRIFLGIYANPVDSKELFEKH